MFSKQHKRLQIFTEKGSKEEGSEVPVKFQQWMSNMVNIKKILIPFICNVAGDQSMTVICTESLEVYKRNKEITETF